MLAPIKHLGRYADDTGMSTPSNASTGRFRRAGIVQSTPAEQLEPLLADGPRLLELFGEFIDAAAARCDVEEIGSLMRVASRAADPQRAYVALHRTVTALHALNQSRGSDSHVATRHPLDLALELLVASLDANPHEPELLDLLAIVLHEFGDDATAARLLDVVLELDPDHAQARAHRRHIRSLRGRTIADVSRSAPMLAATRETVASIVERARVLEDRRVSLCMIVRDEEELLPGCLEAVAPFVDEMIVVDTGSTDRTREIARELGAQVHEFTWTGDFSAARNESLRHATGDWILWLDADEHLVPEDGPKLRELARRTWVEGWSILETHMLGDSDDFGATATHSPMRLFQRRPEHHWTGAVHEQVAASLPGWVPGRVRASTVRVNHYGYMPNVVNDRDKRTRNLELLLRQHDEQPSAFTSFNIGTEHAAVGAWSDGSAWFERALTQLRDEGTPWISQGWTSLLVQRAVTARRLLGDLAGALALAHEGLEAWPDYADLAFEQALVHHDAQEWEQAAERARAALAIGDAPAQFVSIAGKGSFQARHLLATAQRSLGDLDGARATLEQTLDEAPAGYVAPLGDLVEALVESGLIGDELDAAIDAHLGARGSAAHANFLVGTRFVEAGLIDQGCARFERVLAVNERHAQSLLSLAEIALVRKDVESALNFASRVDALDRLAPRAAQTMFVAAVALDRRDVLDEPARRIAKSSALPTPERAVYVAWRHLLVPSDDMHVIVPVDESAQAAVLRNLETLARVEAADAFERLHPLLEAAFGDDEYQRRLQLARLYLRLRFPDMAGEELMLLAQRFGPDAAILTGLGKVATIKCLWEDAEVFLGESLQLDPSQNDARNLLDAVRSQIGA